MFGLMVEDFCGVFPGWKFDDSLSTFMDGVVCWLLNRR